MKEEHKELELLAIAIMTAYCDATGVFLEDEVGYLCDASANGEVFFVQAIRTVLGRCTEGILLETAISAQDLSLWIACNEYELYQSETDASYSYGNQIEQFRICRRIAVISRWHFPGIYPQCLNIAKETALYTMEGQRKYREYRNKRCTL